MRFIALAALVAMAASLAAQSNPTVPAETLLDRAVLKALDEELSGVAAKDHVGRLAQLHRVPASPGFHEAIEYVMARARAAGLSDVQVSAEFEPIELSAVFEDIDLLARAGAITLKR